MSEKVLQSEHEVARKKFKEKLKERIEKGEVFDFT